MGIKKNTKASQYSYLIFVLFVCSGSSHAQISSEDKLNVFETARYNSDLSPELEFPNTNQEGWVEFSFMVDSQGKPYEQTVIDSAGGEKFIEKAEQHLLASTYRPGTFDGTPVDSSYSMRYRFEFEDGPSGVGQLFYQRYKFFQSSLSKNEIEKSKTYLEKLEASNLYEDAFLNIAHFLYQKEIGGDLSSQIYYLKRAIDGDYQKKYLPPEIYLSGNSNLFQSQVNSKDYQGALETYERILEADNSEEMVEAFRPTVDSIRKVKNDDTIYSLTGTLNDHGRWSLPLLKSSFDFREVSGELSEIKLRCYKKFVFFEFLENQQYHIPKSYGECDMELIGHPNTTFTLIQAASIESQNPE